jgi:Ca2+-binding RTX toxin-like protein
VPLTIHLISDNSVASAPAGFSAAIQSAASMIEQAFSDNITINLRYGWGSYNNTLDSKLVNSGGAYAQALAGDVVPYATLRSWLAADSSSSQDTTAVGALPAGSSSFPGGNNSFFVTSAQERALGHFTGSTNAVDGAIAFGTGVASTSWVPVALHEITHAMGRLSLHYETAPVVFDMFRYDAAGHFQWTEGSVSAEPSYFSIDGGVTRLADFGRTSDYSDFLNTGVQGPNDPFNEFYGGTTINSLTSLDITTLDVIGFDRVGIIAPPADDYRDSLSDTGVFGAVAVNGTSTGRLEANGDRDWFQVQLLAGTPYLITLQGNDAGGGTLADPYLRVHNSVGALLAENDDIVSGSNHDSQLTLTPSASGTYYVEAGAFNDLATGTYRVGVSSTGPTDDFRDSLADTTAPFGQVAVNGASTGNLEVAGDRDWFSVVMNAGTTYVVNLQGLQSGAGTLEDAYLRLNNSAGTLMAQNDDIVFADNRDSQLTIAITATGTYYVEAGAFDDGYTGTYRVSVSSVTTVPDDFRDSLTDTTAPLGQLGLNQSTTGRLEVTGDRDWFQMSLTAGVSYLIDLQGLRAGGGTLDDPYLRLHNSTGVLAAESDDIELGIDRDSRLIFQATASGTYYLEAGAFDDAYTGTYTARLTASNRAPVITSNGGGDTASVAVAENVAAVTTVTATDPVAAAVLVYSLAGGADQGQFQINASTGALSFIAPPNFEAPTDSDANNSYIVQVRVSDGTLTDTQTITVNVGDVNDNAPVITTAAMQSVAENTTIVAALTSTDADTVGTLPAAFSITGGVDAARFAIANGNLVFVSAPNFESPTDSDVNNSYVVQVTANDGAFSVNKTVTVNVANVNEVPTITSSGAGDTATVGVLENSVAVVTVTATDPDAATTLVYSLVGGVDQAKFQIGSSTGVLTFITAPNFEVPTDSDANNSYIVQVRVSDGTLTDTQTITVNVGDVNDNAPVITTAATQSVAENTTTVAALASTDADTVGTIPAVFSITGGVDAARFAIANGNLVFVSAPNFESPADSDVNNSYVVQVTANDGVASVNKTITVGVTNVNEVPTITSNGAGDTATVGVLENSAAVVTVTATDPDAATTLVYSLVGGADQAKFQIGASNGVLSFIAAPNFEAPTDSDANNSYVVQVRVSDGTLTDAQTITVNVGDVNDNAPVITTPATQSLTENTTLATALTSTDADTVGLNPRTFTITGGVDAARFNIVAGNLQFVALPDFDNAADADHNNSYIVQVTAFDGVNSVNKTLTVNVTDVNDNAPVITTAATQLVLENTTLVAALTSTDVDTVGISPAVFSITGGADAAKFTIVAGGLAFIAAPDFENPSDSDSNNSYLVQVSAADGVNVGSRALTVNVGNVVETVFSAVTAILPSSAENLTLTGLANIDGTGNGLNNVLTGNPGRNVLAGLAGNDTLLGGAGIDTALFTGPRSAHVIVNNGTTVTVSGAEGTDTLTGMERLQFADALIRLTGELTDINSDGRSDLLWRNSDGTLAAWPGGSPANGLSLGSAPTSFSIVDAQGDYNGDGRTDILWRDADGAVSTWLGSSPAGGQALGAVPTSWRIVDGHGDYNGDGRSDILWRNADGAVATWFSASQANGMVQGVIPLSWSIFDAQGDYNGDGCTDILWRNSDGTLAAWFSGSQANGQSLGFVPLSWSVVDGHGDYNADGRSDVLWRNSDGTVAAWLGGAQSNGQVQGVLPASWTIVDAHADYDGDGRSDILFRNSDGTVATWLGGLATNGRLQGAIPASWSILDGNGDYNGDARSDILWRNSDGAVAVWFSGEQANGQSLASLPSSFRDPHAASVNNSAPQITMPAGPSIAENTALVAALTAIDADTVGLNAATFSVSGGADAARFTIVGGNLVFVAAPDFENAVDADHNNSYLVQVTAFDGLNATNRTLSVNVTDANDNAPAITTAATQFVAENSTLVAALTSTDADAVGVNPATFSITGGADAARFVIVGGNLVFAAAPDFENPADADHDNSYLVQVTTSDGLNATNKALTVNVTDLNDNAPVITTPASLAVLENATVAAALAATDADTVGTNPAVFSIIGGADAARFGIAGANLVFMAGPDFENPADADHNNSYVVNVSASDGVNASSRTLTVNVGNVNETVFSAVTATVPSSAENLTLTGNADINGTGDSRANVITGNDGRNVLVGGAGNDMLAGGLGADTASYGGMRSAYGVSNNGAAVIVTGPEGVDGLTGIEWLRFADGLIGLGGGPRIDLNSDGRSDLLWRNSDGALATWLAGAQGSGQTLGTVPTTWSIVDAHGDYNGDGASDILWRDSDGTIATWLGGLPANGQTQAGIPITWSIVDAHGDYDGDGRSDILWRNDDGQVATWLGGSQANSQSLGTVPVTWSIVDGEADYNGDGRSDILWRNSDGKVATWLGASPAQGQTQGTVPLSWTIVDGHGDYNGDGRSDILWRDSDGTVAIWLSGAQANGQVQGVVPISWTVADGHGDYDGDGRSDILWRNSDGAVATWLGGSQANGQTQGVIPLSWTIVDGHEDYNGDGLSDIRWRNSDGAAATWLSGSQASGQSLGSVPGEWSIVDGAEMGAAINGSAAADVLTGTVGRDTLYGGAGNDTLSGAGGADRFAFNSPLDALSNVDTLTDFVPGNDTLFLDQVIFAGAPAGLLAATRFVAEAGAAAHDGDDLILYDTVTGALSYDADGSGPGSAVLFAMLVNAPALAAQDVHMGLI